VDVLTRHQATFADPGCGLLGLVGRLGVTNLSRESVLLLSGEGGFVGFLRR
jgi:hypothetical protein